MYNWITLLYSKDWHNIVNQLHVNKRIKLVKKGNINSFQAIYRDAKSYGGLSLTSID